MNQTYGGADNQFFRYRLVVDDAFVSLDVVHKHVCITINKCFPVSSLCV